MQDHNIYEDLLGKGGGERKGVHGLTQHQAVKIHT